MLWTRHNGIVLFGISVFRCFGDAGKPSVLPFSSRSLRTTWDLGLRETFHFGFATIGYIKENPK